MYCPSCGKQLSDESRFCARCGALVAPTGAAPQGVPPTEGVPHTVPPNGTYNELAQPPAQPKAPGIHHVLVAVTAALSLAVVMLMAALVVRNASTNTQGHQESQEAISEASDQSHANAQKDDAGQSAGKSGSEAGGNGVSSGGGASEDGSSAPTEEPVPQVAYDPLQYTTDATTLETMDFVVTVPSDWAGLWECNGPSQDGDAYTWMFSIPDSSSVVGAYYGGIVVTSDPNGPQNMRKYAARERIFDEPSSNGMYLFYVVGDPQRFFAEQGGQATITLK